MIISIGDLNPDNTHTTVLDDGTHDLRIDQLHLSFPSYTAFDAFAKAVARQHASANARRWGPGVAA